VSIDFVSPSYRAAGSDLSIAISPLGLVELSDEEFEVHGPRLNRYAQAWAFYLGHHWAYRREAGEPQITFNYVRSMSDWMTNFCFSKGVTFQVPHAYQHTVPALLQRIWEKDNHKQQVIWEIGNQGSIQGDAFIKIAYEPPFTDKNNIVKPGKVRILPLNASFCFPEWHPHDRERMIRFKLKYRFWGTSPEGTRQVYTYVEIITDDVIEEYVNDELIDRRENPLGFIPVVHIANHIASASPWGLSDITDIIPLNRDFNEKATEVSDIINYHTAPVTVITGAKASNLEKGPNKIWALTSKDARVENLSGGVEGLPHAIEFLQLLKLGMHEMIGIPEGALGVAQPISNTSGVALAIQFMPSTMIYDMKRTQYGRGIEEISRIALKTLFLFEPDQAVYDPMTEGIREEADQPVILDIHDPAIYDIRAKWPAPLPVDEMVKLSELQSKQQMGLESKIGMLRELGIEFPDEKFAELFAERLEDLKQEAAMRIIDAQANAVIMKLTGLVPEGYAEQDEKPKPGEPGKPASAMDSQPLPSVPDISDILGMTNSNVMEDISTYAYGTKLPQRRNISNTNDD
jgi:Phage portal protein, SPP1 Gp6-like